MRKFTFLSAVSTLLLMACGTVPPEWNTDAKVTSTDGESATKVAALSDPNRKVCKKTKVSGSQFDKKVCMTAKEWYDIEQASKAGARDIQSKGARNIRRGPNS